MNSHSWYYVADGNRIGPVDAAEIEHLIAEGTLSRRTLVWQEGMDGWEQAGAHFPPDQPGTPPPVPGMTDLPRAGSRRPAASARTDRTTGIDGLYIHAPARSFTEAISVCLGKFVTFSGRASRSEYWYFFLFTVLAGMVAAFLDAALFDTGWDDEFSPLNTITNLVLLLPTLAVGWRRLHDIDRSGWWIGGFWLAMIGGGVLIAFMGATGGLAGAGAGAALLGIGVLVYVIVMLVFLCTRGDPGPNRFG